MLIRKASNLIIFIYLSGIKSNSDVNHQQKMEVVDTAPVYNCVNYVDNPLTWGDVKEASVPMVFLFFLKCEISFNFATSSIRQGNMLQLESCGLDCTTLLDTIGFIMF